MLLSLEDFYRVILLDLKKYVGKVILLTFWVVAMNTSQNARNVAHIEKLYFTGF